VIISTRFTQSSKFGNLESEKSALGLAKPFFGAVKAINKTMKKTDSLNYKKTLVLCY